MKKGLYIFCFLAFTVTVFSQRQTQYNKKGDEAMERHDYSDAKIWYEEGVADCNSYSITQLTNIWVLNEPMRISMRNVMSRCLTCLNDRATETKDPETINKLILYYTEGIGTQANERTARFWRDQLDAIVQPNIETVVETEGQKTKKEKGKINVFVGYSVNQLVPAGLSVGIAGKSIGGYVRYRTNYLSPQPYTEIVDKSGIVTGLSEGYSPLDNKKVNAMMITGGLIFKPTQEFLVSIGGGYWKRDLMYKFEKTNLTVTKPEGTFWAICEDLSYEGLAIDLDGTLRIGKIFYLSAGCTFPSLKFIYSNVGIGVFF